MRAGTRFRDNLTHSNLQNLQGGNYHLTADEYENLMQMTKRTELLKAMCRGGLSVYAFGKAAQYWAGNPANFSENNMYRITLPEGSTPVRVVTANRYTFCVLLKNEATYAYSVASNKYVLNSGTIPAALGTPIRFELGSWIDLYVPSYYTTSPGGLSSSIPVYKLLSTEKHNRLIREYEGDMGTVYNYVGELQYNSTGRGFTGKNRNNVAFSLASIASSAVIKSAVINIHLSTSSVPYSFFYTTRGIYHVSCAYSTSKTYSFTSTLVNFPYGTIKNAWVTSDNIIFVQNTENLVYKAYNSGSTTVTWTGLGEWDVKDIVSRGIYDVHMITNSGKLYRLNNETFQQIYPEYRFASIAFSLIDSNTSGFMGIGCQITQ